jgi:hypothetical protein
VNKVLRFLYWFAELDGKSVNGKFKCPRCGSDEFIFVNDPVFSTSSRSESRTKALCRCAGFRSEGRESVPCNMRYVFVSHDFGKSWSPYEPSN